MVMVGMNDLIRPYVYVALRLSSENIKVEQIKPNTYVTWANHILGRPYHLTFEIVEKPEGDAKTCLRIVGAAELHEHVRVQETALATDSADESLQDTANDLEYEVIDEHGKIVLRTNRHIVDDTGSQKLSMEDIEELKRQETASGKDTIARIMESHTALDKKSTFALAKYTLRKVKKYMRRFTVLPLDVPLLAHWMLHEKDSSKILEIREEILALVCSWSNVHYHASDNVVSISKVMPTTQEGRWLVVDETGGLLVAAMAERMGILYPEEEPSSPFADNQVVQSSGNGTQAYDAFENIRSSVLARETFMSAKGNSLTLIHANSQPNLSLLTYFAFDPTSSPPSHPLHSHFRSLSWFQLLSPNEDSGYTEPPLVPDSILSTWKGGKKGTYYRKRRRWERIKTVVDETRAGGFDGLVVASVMNPTTILRHAVPLLRGGAQVVVYSPTVEPLAELVDYHSTARRTAFLNSGMDANELPNEDFPTDPTLLLASTIYTARARHWQVLPGRTHPLMTGRGGAEGYVFTATRVLPIVGEKVEARGSFKRRKVVKGTGSASAGTGEDETAVAPLAASLSIVTDQQ